MTLDPTALDAACEAYEDHGRLQHGWMPWAEYGESTKAECREDMRAAIEAWEHHRPGLDEGAVERAALGAL